MVLREARTLPMKVLAEAMLEDDIQLLSRMLNQPTMDRVLATRELTLVQPMTKSEYSLRWPIQNEFMLGYRRAQQADHGIMPEDTTDTPSIMPLAHTTHLRPDQFRMIEHPKLRHLFGIHWVSQRMWNTYANFYDATIKAADSVHSPLPKLGDIARDSSLMFLERVAHPLDVEPNWEPFSQRLVETDARLRLVSLQILLRKPSSAVTVPTRLAEVGSMYFDPFTGFPMLWSPTQKKLYSVGQDGLDDGGDPTFDISVPLAAAMNPSSHSALR